jgi:zinc transporter 7
MVAFAVGGLLGDTLFHLLPEIFLGEDSPEHVRFVLVEPNRNLLLGVAIMVGFVTFVAMDKGLRIATGGEGGHDHGHSHKAVEVTKPVGSTSALEASPAKSTRSRSKKENGNTDLTIVKGEKEINASVKLAGYLNLMYMIPL